MIALVALASCSKSEAQVPEQPNQWVTITASCESCTIEIQEPNNTKSIHFGGWISYTYQNVTGQKSAKAILSVPVKYIKSQELYLQVKESLHGNVINKTQVIRSYIEQGNREAPYVLELELNLKDKLWR